MNINLRKLYLAPSRVACFDGEGGDGGAGSAGAGAGTGDAAAAAAAVAAAAAATVAAAGSAGSGTGGGDAGKTGDGGSTGKPFDQDDVNRFLAEDRRKHQAALAQVELKLTEALTDKDMTEATRKALEDNLSSIQGQLRTKEQQLALEKQQLEESHGTVVIDLKKKVEFWENLYRDSTVERSLQDAAVKNEAFNADQIVVLLRPQTKLLEEVDEESGKPTGTYRPMVTMKDVDPKTGEPATMVRTPAEAVKRMKELPETYGNLFKSGVVSGIGAGQATSGTALGKGGKVDVRKLTPQQYRELREKDPEALGLRPNR